MDGTPEHAEEEQVGPVRRVRPAGGPEQHGPVLRLHLRSQGGGNVGRRVGRENAQVGRNQSSRRSATSSGLGFMGVPSNINGTHTDSPNSLFDCAIESPAKDGCLGAFVGCFIHAFMNFFLSLSVENFKCSRPISAFFFGIIFIFVISQVYSNCMHVGVHKSIMN